MSEQEMLVLSTKERDRLKVLHEVKRGHLTQRAAAAQLGISDRWVRKLLIRVQQEGDRGVVHGLRGRASKRRLPETLRSKALKLVQAKYGDFGPTLACEYLAKKDGVKVSKETLRQWLVAAGLRRVKGRKAEEVHVWRPRRSCRGELVQWDTSEHDWLEGRGPQLYLVAMIDDAPSRAYARFVRHDSTEENLRVLRGYLERWGRPVEFYTDKSSLFRVNRPQVEGADEAVKEELTQIGRGLRELGIGWMAARVVKKIEGVEKVDNQIEVLPVSSNDDRIRAAAFRAIYGYDALRKYDMGTIKPIRIIVKNGRLTLEGVVDNEADKKIINIRANGVHGVFSVTNNLQVVKPE